MVLGEMYGATEKEVLGAYMCFNGVVLPCVERVQNIYTICETSSLILAVALLSFYSY